MQYRNLGNTGMKVSEISLGTWLSCDSLEAKTTSIEIIDKAYELGINFFDTACSYSDGRSEMILGEALKKHPRESYVLTTKVYFPFGSGVNSIGLSRKNIMYQVDASLKKLGTDYIDLYYCHWFDLNTPVEETLRAMDDLVRQGKILYIGVSNWTAAQISEGLRVCDKHLLYKMVANQPSYNLFDRYIEKESIPLCEMNGISQVVYSPLAQGILTGKYKKGMKAPEGSRAVNPGAKGAVTVRDYLNDELLDKVEVLEKIAGEMGISISQLALAWILRQPNVASTIIGASRPAQVEENVKASGIKLSGEVLKKIEELVKDLKYVIKHNIIG